MPSDKNPHADHRSRLRAKALPRVDALTTPQLMELLLFEALPRCDTNAVGHALLEKYGGAAGITDPENHIPLTGGADVTAQYLHALGTVCRRYAAYRSPDCVRFYSMAAARAWFLDRVRGGDEDEICILTLAKDMDRVRFSRYPSAGADLVELIRRLGIDAVSDYCPFLFMALTHPQGVPLVSRLERKAVSVLSQICFENGVTLADVLIVTDEEHRFLSESDAFPPGTFLKFN